MLLAFFVLLHWLLPASGGNGYLKEDESVIPPPPASTMVASLGANVTIKCNRHPSTGHVSLEKEGRVIDPCRDYFRQLVIFHIIIKSRKDAGTYRCWYSSARTRQLTNSVELLIRDPSLPKPSLSLNSVEEFSIGQRVSMHCGTPGTAERFYFGKNDFQDWSKYEEVNTFTINYASKMDAGIYSCSYTSLKQLHLLSEPSNPLELVLIDPDLPRPTISSLTSRFFTVGKETRIMCEIEEEPAVVYLHQPGESRKQARDSYANVIQFYLRKMTLKDKGNYSCSWAKLESPFVVSKRSNPLELLVSDDAPKDQKQGKDYAQISQSLAVVSGILVVLLFLILSVGAFLWFKGKSNSIGQATQSSDGHSFRVLKKRWGTAPASTSAAGRIQIHKPFPKDDAPTETEDIIYAELKKEAPVTQEETKSEDGSEDLVYASVFQHTSQGVQAQREDE